MNPSELHNVEGVTFNIAVQGIGEPLVLLHGGYSNLTAWDLHVDRLAQHFQVIRYDQRGYGQSEAIQTPFSYYKDLKAVMGYLGISRASLAGSSFGGSAAIDFALAYPQLVSKLILVAPSVNGAKYPLRLSWEGIKDYLRVRRLGMDKAAEHFMNHPFWNYLIPQEQPCKDQFKKLYLGNEIYYQGKPNLHRPLLPHAYHRLNEISHPALVIEAEKDLPFNKRISTYVGEQIPGCEFVQLKQCGHYPQLEHPDEFMEIIIEFLKKPISDTVHHIQG